MSSGDGLHSFMPETMTVSYSGKCIKREIRVNCFYHDKIQFKGREGGREGGKEGENKGLQERNLRLMMEKLVVCLWGKSKLLSPPVRQEHREGQWGSYGNAERELTCRASSRALITM